MPKAVFSAYLEERRAELRKTVAALRRDFDFASVLAADSRGFNVRATPKEVAVSDSEWSERGFVFRVQRDGRIAEWSTDEFESCAADYPALRDRLESLMASFRPEDVRYPAIAEEACSGSWRGGCELDPFSAEIGAIIDPVATIAAKTAPLHPEITFFRVMVKFHGQSKLYLSEKRELDQAFFRAEGSAWAVAGRGAKNGESYSTFSGLKGLEILGELESAAGDAARTSVAHLDADAPVPGEYDVICGPDIAGLIAHEAFGHGVETDMFAKGRAKASEYMGKRVGSPLVTMYDGAAGVEETGTYWFDDEGNVSQRTLVIDNGILVSGLSDALSALSLSLPATGNGRRQDFSRKAYARMTNTYFAPGKEKLEDMIASVKKGYLLENYSSGMEDPKNWGIQLMIYSGKEILDGKLTGRLIAPIVCSGYVPDLLESVSMVSGDFELSGSGYCGKGHKEYVKVSSGGPYLKARMRLA